MISTAPPSTPSTTPTLMAGKKPTTRAPQQQHQQHQQQSVGGTAAAAPSKKVVVMKANGRQQQQQQQLQQQQTTPAGPEADRMPSLDSAGPIPLRRISHTFDHQQHNHHQSAKTLSAPPGYHQQQQQITGVFVQPSLNTTPPVALHNTDSSDCGSSSGLGGMGTPTKGEEGCSASCSTSSNNSMAADCSLDSHDQDSGGGPMPSSEKSAGVDIREQTAVSNGHRSLLASTTLTPSMVSPSSHLSGTIPPVSAPIFQQSVAPQQQVLQQSPFNAFVSPIPLLNTHQPNTSQINALHCALSDGPSPLMAPPLPSAAATGVIPYAAAASNTGRTSSAPSVSAPSAVCGGGGSSLQSPAALMSKSGLKQLHSPPPLSGRALYTMTCETNALASVSAAALTAGYHVTLDPSASAPPIIATIAATAPAEFQLQETVPMSKKDNKQTHQQQQRNNEASPHGQKEGNGNGAAMNSINNTTTTANNSSRNNSPSANDRTPTGNSGDTALVNLPPGVPPEIAAAINGGNDLFVHIHPGDAIALAVGNDIQHIHGPATIRMVSQSTAPQSAIPMNVPEGHIIQQILDRQGNLSHIIMSQEGVPPVGAVGPLLAQHALAAATSVMSQMPSAATPPTAASATTAQQRPFQPHVTVPLKHFRSNNSPPHSSDAPASSDGGASRQKQQHPGMAAETGGVYPSGVVPLLKWSDLPHHHHPHPHHHHHGHQPHQREHYQSQSGGPPYGGKHQQQQQGRGGHAVPSPSSTYHLVDSTTVPSAHYQPRHSPGFYALGGAMENQSADNTQNVTSFQQQQQQHAHSQSAQSANHRFETANLPPQIASSVIEDDEKERLRDTLSSLQPPILSRVSDRDAEVIWQEIDTSEAAASGGPFPQIDPSEFVYQLTLYDTATHSQTFYKTEAGVTVLHLRQLSPGTEYMVAVRAELPERNINGHPSAFTSFRTLSALPEAPPLPKVVGRQQNCLSIQWKPPNCNGAPILSYCLQLAKGKMASFETVYDGVHEQTVVSGLDSAGLCRFRVFARNEYGQSESSPVLTVYPERGDTGGRGPLQHHHHNHHHQQQQQHHGAGTTQRGGVSVSSSSTTALPAHHHNPQQQTSHTHNQPIRPPHSPSVYSTAARAIKLSWSPLSGADFTSLALEMADPSNTRGSTHFQAVSTECYANSGTFAHIIGLIANHEYRFRLAAMTAAGDVLYSEPITARTRPAEQTPTFGGYGKERRELDGAQHHHQNHAHHHYHHENKAVARTSILGHDSADHPQHLHDQTPPTKKLPILQTSSKKQQKNVQQKHTAPQQQSVEVEEPSAAEETAAAVPTQKAPNCTTPTFSALTSGSARVAWKVSKCSSTTDDTTKGTTASGDLESKSNSAKGTATPSQTALLFELQRVDKQQPMMVYSGAGLDFEYKGLRPVEHMQLRVRAVLLDTEGRRVEGDWSPVASTCTLCAPPLAPQNLRLATEDDGTLDNANTSPKASVAVASAPIEGAQWHSVGIFWDPPAQLNGATVSGYSLHIQRFELPTSVDAKAANAVAEKPLEEQTMNVSGTECHFIAQHLRPAQLYRFIVSAQSDAGPSPKSELLDYRTPPGVPGKPRDVHVEALSTTELQLSWSEPISANGSPIVSYHVNCFKLGSNIRHQLLHDSSSSPSPVTTTAASFSNSKRQLVSQQITPASQRLLVIQSLEAETDYELVIQAENSVGKSDPTVVKQKTLVEPPEPPQIFLAQATANSLKLKWSDGGENNNNSHSIYYYYLERENENGTYSPVYEGELRTARLKGLREQSVHHFRIRASVSKGLLLGPWSRRFSFQTTKLPPPAPKQAPSVVEHTPDHFQFEWNSVRFRDQNGGATGGEEPQTDDGGEFQLKSELVYRLQMAPKMGSLVKEKSAAEVWKTIFEDKMTQTPPIYVHNASQQARQVRLFVVQRLVDANGRIIEELVSAPSPIAVFSSLKTPNESPKKRNLQSQQHQQGTSSSSRTTGAVAGRKATNPYPLPKETKMSFGKKIRRMASWLRKTVSEKDCALIVLAIFVMLAFGIAILLNNFYLN